MKTNYTHIIEKAKIIAGRIASLENNDPRFSKVIGFFKAKKLLIRDNIPALPRASVKAEDILWVAENIEPRVLEVLPAAVLHYPSSIKNLSKLPAELKNIITQIKNNEERGDRYKHIEYETFFKWAQYNLGDGRLKPEKDKRITRSFRISKTSNAKLTKIAASKRITISRLLDQLVESYEKTSPST